MACNAPLPGRVGRNQRDTELDSDDEREGAIYENEETTADSGEATSA